MINFKKTLSKETRFLLIIGMLYLAGTNIAMTFINVYLVRVTNHIGVIIIQNMINYFSLLCAFVWGTKLISKINLQFILKLGMISTALYYLFIYFVIERKKFNILNTFRYF